jgi:putative transposase
MPNGRRFRVAGGTYFFTIVTDGREQFLCGETARELLGDAMRRCRVAWPFQIDAIVLLPDHLHAIWTLPRGDDAYPRRWAWIKKEFTKAWLQQEGHERMPTAGRHRDRRRGVWQSKYWEHTIQDELDYERHFDYIHFNPVKHGLVLRPHQWSWSSFHRWVRAGAYPPEWGCFEDPDHMPIEYTFRDIAKTVGE